VSVLFVLRQGGFAARVNALVLGVALPLSFVGALRWGLVGAAAGSVAAMYIERWISLGRISRLTATPLGRLQDWRTLAGLALAAALSAAAAGLALHWSEWSSLPTILAGATITAAAYPVFLGATGQWKELVELIQALRGHRPAVVTDRNDA
jgi:hypothetical protein